jgi:hypothetical protein
MDVPGTKAWLGSAACDDIANTLDAALGAATDQQSSGKVNGQPVGALVGVTHVSDSILAWAPDDSWGGLAVRGVDPTHGSAQEGKQP